MTRWKPLGRVCLWNMSNGTFVSSLGCFVRDPGRRGLIPHPDDKMSQMVPRDPIANPLRGDEFKDGRYIRRVIDRTGDMLRISSGNGGDYWMSVERWKEWCERTGAKPTEMMPAAQCVEQSTFNRA
jgi:hypothetical protein